MYISIDRILDHKHFHFNSFWGFLISKPQRSSDIEISNPPKCNCSKWDVNYNAVENPYECSRACKPSSIINNSFLKYYARFLIWSYQHCYCFVWLCSFLRLSVFENGEESCQAFFDAHPTNQRVLCLPRSIFIATTSKKFKKSGVMFIGSFFPSRRMHAWVMEDGHNCCPYDNCWINYTPVCAMI